MVSLSSRHARRKSHLRKPVAPAATAVKGSVEPFALAALRLAADHFERTRHLHNEAWVANGATGANDRAWMIAGILWSEAEANLVNAILALDPTLTDHDLRAAGRGRQSARGVRLGSKVYLAVPDPNVVPGEESPEHPTMRLSIVDLDAIHNLDAKGAEGA